MLYFVRLNSKDLDLYALEIKRMNMAKHAFIGKIKSNKLEFINNKE
ncbi:MAG: hypothetical protein ACJAZ2_001798 [Glaciecola sp.]|jgi:hypothetical protein